MFSGTDVCYGLLFAVNRCKIAYFVRGLFLRMCLLKMLLMGKEIYQPDIIGMLTIR